MDRDINHLQKILQLEGRQDIADLLADSSSELQTSTQYGNYLYSVLSTFAIYSSVENNHSLRKLADSDKEIILNAVQEIYPPRDAAPEVVNVEFFIGEPLLELGSTNEESDLRIEQPAVAQKVIKVFMSYSTHDKAIAGELKRRLEALGMRLEVFLAHEDIFPSREWEDEILYYLERSDVFIPLITKHFDASDWTHQECGVAVVKKQLIIPISVSDEAPPVGFIGKFQAAFLKQENMHEVINMIRDAIIGHEILGKHTTDSIIDSFIASRSWNMTRELLPNLQKIKLFSPTQINRLVDGCINNIEIRQAFGVDDVLMTVVSPYKNQVDLANYVKFLERFAPPIPEATAVGS